MSSSYPQTVEREFPSKTLPWEDRRGLYVMWCVVATEAALFACLFASYFYLGSTRDFWGVDRPPAMRYAWLMLAVLIFSGIVLRWGEIQVNREKYSAGRISLIVATLLGLAYLALVFLDYRSHLRTLTPYSNSYGSIFYAISGFHILHVVVGILILAFTLFLPTYRPSAEPPYRPYQTAALYWYFVNVLWIFVFVIMYLIPNLTVHG